MDAILSGRAILIVEDEPLIAMEIVRAFESAGARVLKTSTLRQALVLVEELGMRPLQAHCHRGLGMLYATTGQREQARTALSTAIEMYQSMEMAFWLPQAEAALAQVDA